jgi:hypothetical protein
VRTPARSSRRAVGRNVVAGDDSPPRRSIEGVNPFGHIDLRVANLEAALTFYDALVPALGFTERPPPSPATLWVTRPLASSARQARHAPSPEARGPAGEGCPTDPRTHDDCDTRDASLRSRSLADHVLETDLGLQSCASGVE